MSISPLLKLDMECQQSLRSAAGVIPSLRHTLLEFAMNTLRFGKVVEDPTVEVSEKLEC